MQSDACRMIRRRAVEAGIRTKSAITCSSTGITGYLRTGGRRESARKWPTNTNPPALQGFTTARDDEVSMRSRVDCDLRTGTPLSAYPVYRLLHPEILGVGR